MHNACWRLEWECARARLFLYVNCSKLRSIARSKKGGGGGRKKVRQLSVRRFYVKAGYQRYKL